MLSTDAFCLVFVSVTPLNTLASYTCEIPSLSLLQAGLARIRNVYFISGTVRPSIQKFHGHVSLCQVCCGLRFVRLHCVSPNRHHASSCASDRQNLQWWMSNRDERGITLRQTTHAVLLHKSSKQIQETCNSHETTSAKERW